MQSLSKILLPVDFSERSAGAARHAAMLAARFGSELILLHVLTPPQYEFGALDIGGSMLTELYRGQAEIARREIDSFLAAELAGLNVRRLVEEGDPARQIVDFAHRERADLIVMPTHGYGPFRRFILGSNTAKVLHDADCPVWTGAHLVESVSANPRTLASVLCAVDLGAQSSKTLAWAALLARGFGARLAVVHAMGCDPDCSESSEMSWRVDLRAAAGQELARLQRLAGVEADLVIEHGEPAAVICSVARRLAADVVVIGRGSAAGVFGRLRTNSYAIIRQSPCPAVSV
jgi:nucleotide-binding universal stress UspA family protein